MKSVYTSSAWHCANNIRPCNPCIDTGRMFGQHYAVTVDMLQLTHHVLDGNTATTNYTIYEGYSRRRGHSYALLQ
eukprot:scaffold13152_cov184-Skeletonema_marinoi.AAC.1